MPSGEPAETGQGTHVRDVTKFQGNAIKRQLTEGKKLSKSTAEKGIKVRSHQKGSSDGKKKKLLG